MVKVEQIVTIRFPCGYEAIVETRVSSWIRNIELSQDKVSLTVCPIHGTDCSKKR